MSEAMYPEEIGVRVADRVAKDPDALRVMLEGMLDRPPGDYVFDVPDEVKERVRGARGASVDLVIMPTRGLGSVRRFLLGSTTAKVLHDVDCPVWTGVTGSAPGHVEDEPQLRQVACAIDFGPASGGIIRWAGALAQALRASLTILHASPQLEPVIG